MIVCKRKIKKDPTLPPSFLLSSNTNTQPFLITQPADFISASRQKCKLFGVILIYTIPRKEQKKEKEKKGYPLFFFFFFLKTFAKHYTKKRKGRTISRHTRFPIYPPTLLFLVSLPLRL